MKPKSLYLITLYMGLFILGTTVTVSTSAADETQVNADKGVSQGADFSRGMTTYQANAILDELRQIRLLLERQQRPPSTGAQPPRQTVQMDIDSGWSSLGRSNAPIVVVEFADYQCSYCRQFQIDTFAALKKNFIDTGKVRFVSRDLPITMHQNAAKAAVASRCAADQGRFWEMRNVLFANSQDLRQNALSNYAATLGLDVGIFGRCVESDQHLAEIQKDITDAAALQISGTPTFIVGKVSGDKLDGRVIVGAQPYPVFDVAIQELLRE